jgi:hypothetical protein
MTTPPFEPPPNDTDAFPGAGDVLFPAAVASDAASPWAAPQAWHDYTAGYKDAADLLVEHLEQGGWRANKLRFPILFLYRQHLELIVKSLIRQCCARLGRTDDFPKHHDLHRLWLVCVGLLHEISPGASADEVRETGRLFREISTLDPAADAFRFPENKSGGLSPANALDVNVGSVREIVEKISFFVECLDTSITVQHDAF